MKPHLFNIFSSLLLLQLKIVLSNFFTQLEDLDLSPSTTKHFNKKSAQNKTEMFTFCCKLHRLLLSGEDDLMQTWVFYGFHDVILSCRPGCPMESMTSSWEEFILFF